MQETMETRIARDMMADRNAIKGGQPYYLYRTSSHLRAPGSKPCQCGRIISANKPSCRSCATLQAGPFT